MRANRLAAALFILVFSGNAFAWGEDGHRVVGALAMEQTDKKAKAELERILGSVSREQMAKACTWADVVRPTPEWEHTYPWHYINPPPWSDNYLEERDCPDGACLPYRVKWSAQRLGDERLSTKEREQAFNFLCHFMGDLHQPMHNAFGYDRGGNDYELEYNGAVTDLHTLWDHDFIERFHPSWPEYTDQLAALMPPKLTGAWSPSLVHAWSDESRAHAKTRMYPDKPQISADYEQKALLFIDQQLRLAASRMAWILNSVLGEGEVKITAQPDA